MISIEELKKIPYLDTSQVMGRTPLLMPLWNGEDWQHWFQTNEGKIFPLKPIDVAFSNYVAKEAALKTDIYFELINLLWQRLNYSEIVHVIGYLQDDIRNMAISCSKIRFLFENRENTDSLLLSSYVETEIEYIIILARTIFDLSQEIIAFMWNERTCLNDPQIEKIRKSVKIRKKFADIVLRQNNLVTANDISVKYGLPTVLSETYIASASFFLYLRNVRDRIVHGGKGLPNIFVTERGFCINPSNNLFNGVKWSDKYRYNENLVSLYPWLSYIIFQSLESCNNLIMTFGNQIQLLPDMFPGYRIFVRDYSNHAFLELMEVQSEKVIWWSA